MVRDSSSCRNSFWGSDFLPRSRCWFESHTFSIQGTCEGRGLTGAMCECPNTDTLYLSTNRRTDSMIMPIININVVPVAITMSLHTIMSINQVQASAAMIRINEKTENSVVKHKLCIFPSFPSSYEKPKKRDTNWSRTTTFSVAKLKMSTSLVRCFECSQTYYLPFLL